MSRIKKRNTITSYMVFSNTGGWETYVFRKHRLMKHLKITQKYMQPEELQFTKKRDCKRILCNAILRRSRSVSLRKVPTLKVNDNTSEMVEQAWEFYRGKML